MTAYTLSTFRGTTFNLATGDQFTMPNQGSILVTTANTAAILGAGGNVLSLNGHLSSSNATGGHALQLNAGNNSITIADQAHIFAGASGVYVNGGSNGIANTGTITAIDIGILCADGNNSIVNGGAVFGQTAGVGLLAGAASTIVNTGAISSELYGVYSIPALNLSNTGTIDGGNVGIYCGSGSLAPNTLTNSGYIYGRTSTAVTTIDGADSVVNNGFIQGGFYAVTLGAGHDFFDGRNGIQVGTVEGSNGNDVLYGGISFDDLRGGAGNDHISGGTSADYLDGGADFDLVRYDFATSAVTANLANAAVNTGEAAGDVLLNFEGIVGSNFADMLIGDGAANTIYGGLGGDAIAGGAGVDTLSGGAGGDVLFGEDGGDLIIGGAGGDILRGGLGGDLFVFNVGDNGDLIQNFNEGGVRDGFDLRGFFDATGYAGTDPRGAGLMQVLQNGADTDVYLYDSFAFRIEGVVAAAIDDTYFLFQ
jgi:Ca2+-binding RTX toxin-like protein